MRDFSWNYFAMTGDIESYLLYKQCEQRVDGDPADEQEERGDNAEVQ